MTKKNTDPAKAAAKAELQRQREIDAAAAVAEYHAGKAADLQNMAHLKALRLAKVAADQGAKKTRRASTRRARESSSIA
jgi:hypothetical protein